MSAWWSGSVGDLLTTNAEAVAQRLALRLVETHQLNRETQVRAWREQVPLLQAAFRTFPANWRIILEYPLLRLGRRIDAVLLSDNAIIVFEFKVGATSITNLDRQQTEDYALDLFDFHSESRSHPIVPVLVATNARAIKLDWPLLWHGVTPVFPASAETLVATLREIISRVPAAQVALDLRAWEGAPYRPVPTIVEAATMLYNQHSVSEIAEARADVANLGQTTSAITTAIQKACQDRKHQVVFVTGIPGAGKTLCGLDPYRSECE